jgi:hypothetical protein
MKVNKPGVHLDHMLSMSRSHHINLSVMADQKANMLLTIASVVVTISIPRLIDPVFDAFAAILIFFCLVTIMLAPYAVMPKLSDEVSSSDIPDYHRFDFNLLFFGDIIKLPYNIYELAMEEMLNDPSLSYQAQIKEMYSLGMFLSKKKYRFVRYAYQAFMVGLFCTGLTLLIKFIW